MFRARIALPVELFAAVLSILIGLVVVLAQASSMHAMIGDQPNLGPISPHAFWSVMFVLPGVCLFWCAMTEWLHGEDWCKTQLQRAAICRHVGAVAVSIVNLAGALTMLLSAAHLEPVALDTGVLIVISIAAGWAAVRTRKVWAALNVRIPTQRMADELCRRGY